MTKKTFPNLVADIQENKPQEVSAMVERINSALYKRGQFELAKKPKGSHLLLREVSAKFADSRTVAAFLVALKADPDLMFNRERKAGYRSNLKGFLKVRALIDYVTGKKSVFDPVSHALFASTIVAARLGKTWIASPEQELILSSAEVTSLSEETQKAIRQYQMKHLNASLESRSQSCQFRTTFANLGLYEFSKEEFDDSDSTLGITVNLSNHLIQYLTKRWGLDAFKKG